jgi:hypothetical protein
MRWVETQGSITRFCPHYSSRATRYPRSGRARRALGNRAHSGYVRLGAETSSEPSDAVAATPHCPSGGVSEVAAASWRFTSLSALAGSVQLREKGGKRPVNASHLHPAWRSCAAEGNGQPHCQAMSVARRRQT